MSYLATIPAQPTGTSVEYCITTSTVDLSQSCRVGDNRLSYPVNQPTFSLRGGSRSDAYDNAFTDRHIDAKRDTATNAPIERINLQWGDTIC